MTASASLYTCGLQVCCSVNTCCETSYSRASCSRSCDRPTRSTRSRCGRARVARPTRPLTSEATHDMATNVETSNHTARDQSWAFEPGAELTPQHHAIALLGDGVRTETWLAWDTIRWAPVVVKIARPDHVESRRTIESLRREA